MKPRALLFIECKRSRHPYVFFQGTESSLEPRGVPQVCGLPRSMRTNVADALDLWHHPFFAKGPPSCATFARAISKKKDMELSGAKGRDSAEERDVELSGADPYNTLILPLTKGLEHARSLVPDADPQAAQFSPALHLAVAVLDAPMVLVESPANVRDPLLSPWTRIIRWEATGQAVPAYRWYAVDVVHFGFLTNYVEKHLLPFFGDFLERVRTLTNKNL